MMSAADDLRSGASAAGAGSATTAHAMATAAAAQRDSFRIPPLPRLGHRATPPASGRLPARRAAHREAPFITSHRRGEAAKNGHGPGPSDPLPPGAGKRSGV